MLLPTRRVLSKSWRFKSVTGCGFARHAETPECMWMKIRICKDLLDMSKVLALMGIHPNQPPRHNGISPARTQNQISNGSFEASCFITQQDHGALMPPRPSPQEEFSARTLACG